MARPPSCYLLPVLRPLCLAAFALALGCGSSEPPPPATASHFDAIQRQEAIQDEVRVAVLEAGGEGGGGGKGGEVVAVTEPPSSQLRIAGPGKD